MASGKMRAWRSIVVAQAGMVWAITNKDVNPQAFVRFIETGSLGNTRASDVPYSPKILAGLQASGVFFGGK